MGWLFVTGSILAEDEFDRVAIQVFDGGVEAAALIVAITGGSTRSASSFEGVGVALAYLRSVVGSESDVCWCDPRAA